MDKNVYALLMEFLKNDALLGLGVVLIGAAVQLTSVGELLYAAVFFGIALITLGFRTYRKANHVINKTTEKLAEDITKEQQKT